ncbi:MAG: nitroreductase [Acidobacteria bacterium]|nr:MAG: nitroreductase [Acidobacteriota bacterium]
MTKPADPIAGLRMPLSEAMETQRSIRRLSPDPVDDEIILRLIELGTKAPTGSNFQNWEFVVIKDQTLKARIGTLYEQAWKIYGRAGRALRKGDEAAARSMAAVEWQIEHFEEVPILIVACLRGSRAPFLPVPPVVAATYYGSIFPSIQNILLGARAMGLGAGIVTLPLWSTTRIRRLLKMPIAVLPCAILPVGWPIGRYGPTHRRPPGEITHLDTYGNMPWKT